MTSTSVPGHEEPSSWHVYTSSIESWFTLDNIRSIVSPFEKGVAPQHMVALVLVNFIGLFAHFAKSVMGERCLRRLSGARSALGAGAIAAEAKP